MFAGQAWGPEPDPQVKRLACICNPTTEEAEAGGCRGSLASQSNPLGNSTFSETLCWQIKWPMTESPQHQPPHVHPRVTFTSSTFNDHVSISHLCMRISPIPYENWLSFLCILFIYLCKSMHVLVHMYVSMGISIYVPTEALRGHQIYWSL